MTETIAIAVRLLVRTLILWIVDALSLALASFILPGLTFVAVESTPRWVVIVAAALLLAVVNMLIRPLILLVARPLGWMALFVVGYLVTAIALWITAYFLPGFTVTLWGGLIGGVVIAFFNTIIIGILDVNEDGSFYQNRIKRLARRQPFSTSDEPGKGLMMVEIDGLSYWHLRQALDDGLMPTLNTMVEQEGYQLSLTDCGLPSMTSACQAGIMFGDNYDIPAYRWYDKSKDKLYVSASDAEELNQRYAHGHGLMRQGSSIGNMFDGDAEKSMITMSNLKGGTPEEQKRRAADVSLLMLDPYFLTRALAIFLWGVLRELWEAWRQKRQDVQPRLNRMAHWYPFVRSATCTLLRDLAANIAIMDMMRGAPSIYMLYLGYDEVAHHSGPSTPDAFGELRRLDRTLERLRNVVNNKAPRDYDLIILSDHGQSFGHTFKQRYGIDIKEFIEQLMPEGTTVSQSIGGDSGVVGLEGLAGELSNVSSSDEGSALDKAFARQGEKLASQASDKYIKPEDGAGASVTAYGSGNAAQVYFDLFPRKIKLSELNAAYPELIDRLIAHEGIGLVLGHLDDDTVLAMGKEGTRNLHTGEVTGEDPIEPYAPNAGHGAAAVEKRVWQMQRVMEFPSAGDLWVFSTVYPDGTVAALEELIGSHGGAGGEQTDAFIFHPPDLVVPETRSSMDVFHILDGHRGAPVVEKAAPVEEVVADWTPATLAAGIASFGQWISSAVRCLFLDRSAYEAVAKNATMTGPALLLTIFGALISSVMVVKGFNLAHAASIFGLHILSVFVMFLAGRLLTRRGKFSRTFRAMGFAQIVYVLAPFALAPTAGAIMRPLILILLFVNTWIAGAAAHETTGWRTLILPLVAFLITTVGMIVIGTLIMGTEFAVQGVLTTLGIEP